MVYFIFTQMLAVCVYFWAVLGGLNPKRTKISTFENLTANVFLI